MKNLNRVTNLKQLLRVTIDDVKLVKKDDRYVFNEKAWAWHDPTILEECVVCLAGSVMANTLGANIDKEMTPAYFDNRTKELLVLITELRIGRNAIYLQNLLDNCEIEFDLNNLDSLDLNTYDLIDCDMDEWEKLYNDLV